MHAQPCTGRAREHPVLSRLSFPGYYGITRNRIDIEIFNVTHLKYYPDSSEEPDLDRNTSL